MLKKLCSLIVLTVVFALSHGAVVAKADKFNLIEARGMVHLPNVGPTPPALNSREYEPYRKTGGATITGVMQVMLPDGTRVPCRFGLSHNEAYLFPDTSYTQWAIARWTTLTDRRVFTGISGGEFFPGDDPRIPMPPYLTLGADTLVKDTGCEGDGRFVFRDVPNGYYIVVGSAGLDRLVGSPGESTESAITTPVGPVEVITAGRPSLRTALGQQWTLVSVGKIEVTQPGTYLVRPSALKPAATYFVKDQ